MTLQARVVETSQQLQLARTSFQLKIQERKRADVTLRELEKIGDDVPTYRAVGRMFLRSSIPEVRQDLDKRRVKVAGEADALQKNIGYLERSVEDGENNLRDFVQKKMVPARRA